MLTVLGQWNNQTQEIEYFPTPVTRALQIGDVVFFNNSLHRVYDNGRKLSTWKLS